MTATPQETLQIHLLPPKAAEQLRIHDALLARMAEGKSPLPLPAVSFEHFSGRGVRYRVLGPEEREAILPVAAGLVGPNATYPELNAKIATESVKRMIVSVTRRAELLTLDGLSPGDWIPLNDAMLAGMPGSEQWRFEKLFTTKDVMVLKAIHRRLHEVSEADVDEIEGKAISVISE